jgi:hypothetical protein
MWTLIASLAELIGVFFLSVEAIKLKNIAALRRRALGFYRTLNPYWEFSDTSEPVTKPEPRVRSLLSKVFAGTVIVVIVTPFVLALAPVIWALDQIEKHTETGIIGIIGFSLWVGSFVINHCMK